MRPWPHAPYHAFNEAGTYIVTSSTLHKELLFRSEEDLNMLHDLLLDLADIYKWKLEAWALFPNHYHFIAQSPEQSTSLKKLITHLHASSARKLNERHQTPGRKVWYQYWDTRITFHKSYLARLHYVMYNPLKHKVVQKIEDYQWCSYHWFAKNATKAYLESVMNFNVDNVNVVDDF